ncbi:MAG: polyprenol monophosphomannose synthase [Actinomycetota bacterium]
MLADFDHEIIVVDDDSPDGTWQVAEDAAATNPRVHVVRRIGRRGLSSAVIDGMAVARGQVLAVLDADLQHDETKLPDLVSAIIDDGADVALGSRQAEGGSYGTFGPGRRFVSWTGAQLAHLLLGVEVSDPMTGFFAVSRERFEHVRSGLDPRGFKIALELLARGERPRVAEVGYCFRTRVWGTTKLSAGVVTAFLWSLALLAIARMASVRFATYAAIAVVGLSMRLSVFSLLTWLVAGPAPAMISFSVAGWFEFGLHQRLTFADRLQQRRRSLPGRLVLFQLIGVHSALALNGAMALLERHRPALGSAAGVGTAFGVSTGAIVLAVTVAYVANTTLTWPRGQGADQASRAKTSPTSPAISVTALR